MKKKEIGKNASGAVSGQTNSIVTQQLHFPEYPCEGAICLLKFMKTKNGSCRPRENTDGVYPEGLGLVLSGCRRLVAAAGLDGGER